VVAIEEVDDEPLGLHDAVPHVGQLGVVEVAVRALPEPDLTGGDEQVAAESAEAVERGLGSPSELPLQLDPWSTAIPLPTLRTEMVR
jgi:hypothetical protein